MLSRVVKEQQARQVSLREQQGNLNFALYLSSQSRYRCPSFSESADSFIIVSEQSRIVVLQLIIKLFY